MRGTRLKRAATQRTIFDQTERRITEGMEVSYRNADSIWKEAAAARVHWLAENVREFTSDDVITHLDEQGITTGNNSALGAILRAAARMGMISNTGHFKESRRVQQHRKPLRIWRSNLIKGGSSVR